jgi:thiamine pyrophosphate-dependent acetolactate synthase large subunit-like protein
MAQTVGDFLVARLHAWGVRRIFGYPGDGINGVFGALQRAGNKIGFVQARHEEMAAFMACAYSKFTGELGVCIATSGPGATHLVTGLYDARLDHVPVLAIAGQQSRNSLGGHYQQEVDLVSLLKDVAGAFVQQASSPAQVRHLVDRAIRIALGERRVTAIVLPNDLQEMDYEEPPRAHGTVHSGVGFSVPKVVPYEADLARAAAVLNRGKRVALLVGAGALGATDEVIAVADRLGAGVAKALLGKAAVPDELPWVTADCPVIALVGDGAMQMNNMAELITVAKYWERWPNSCWIVCVFNNQDLNQVTWERRVMAGDPKFNASQEIPYVPYHRFAELIGLRGIIVDRADEVGPAWDDALSCDRPVVLDIQTDPEVPPLPPHITFRQARNLAQAMAKGDPHGKSVIRGTARQLLSKLLPGWRKNGE